MEGIESETWDLTSGEQIPQEAACFHVVVEGLVKLLVVVSEGALPLLVGFDVSSPAQIHEASRVFEVVAVDDGI